MKTANDELAIAFLAGTQWALGMLGLKHRVTEETCRAMAAVYADVHILKLRELGYDVNVAKAD